MSMKTKHFELEENEEEWWKLWCRVYRKPWAVLYHHPELDEPIFNHATRIKPQEEVGRVSQRITEWYTTRGVSPHIYVTPFFGEGRWETILEEFGYHVNDELMTMIFTDGRNLDREGYRVTKIKDEGVAEWVQAYCATFYNDTSVFNAVLKSVRQAVRKPQVKLLAAVHEKKIRGVMALFERKSTLGLYCLGTLPAYRGRGVATDLLLYASRTAKRSGLKLVLQTFSKDGLREFYIRRGFSIAYAKKVYSWTKL